MSALTPVSSHLDAQEPVTVTAFRSEGPRKAFKKRPRFLYLTLAMVGLFVLIAIAISSWQFLIRTPYDSAMVVSFWQYAVYWFLRGISETAAALLLTLFIFRVLMRYWIPQAVHGSLSQGPLRHLLWIVPFVLAAVIAFGPIVVLLFDNGSLTKEETVAVAIEILSATLVGGMLWLFLWTQVRRQVVELPATAQMAVAAVAKIFVDEHPTGDQLLAVKLNLADDHLNPPPVMAEVSAKGVRVFDGNEALQKRDQPGEAVVEPAPDHHNHPDPHSTLIPVTIAARPPSPVELGEARIIAAYQAEVLRLDSPPAPRAAFRRRSATRPRPQVGNVRRTNECYGLTVREGKEGVFVMVEELTRV